LEFDDKNMRQGKAEEQRFDCNKTKHASGHDPGVDNDPRSETALKQEARMNEVNVNSLKTL